MLTLCNIDIPINKTQRFQLDNLSLKAFQPVLVAGPNGAGKSLLLALMTGQPSANVHPLYPTTTATAQGRSAGSIPVLQGDRILVSTATQQAILDAERKKACADILDIVATPTCAKAVLCEGLHEPDYACELASRLGLGALMEAPFTGLSTGETKKLLLARAIAYQPKWLLLDAPFDGLDAQSVSVLTQLLSDIAAPTTVVIATNAIGALPEQSWYCVYLEQLTISWEASFSDTDTMRAALNQYETLSEATVALPDADSADKTLPDPLVSLTDGQASYNGRVIFEHLNWSVKRQQHWQIIGPNGAGKSVLLAMITGDDSHCYTNQLTVFGYRRGSGESIWDIKKHIGVVSNQLFLQYRVSVSVLDTVLSGFFDSIGLYQQPTDSQLRIARQWLAVLGLTHLGAVSFQSLAEGDKRLTLIARAMVKQPALLILDEPCNNLDTLNRRKVLAVVQQLMQRSNSTVLYVNHQREDVLDGISQQLDMSDYRPAP